MTRILLALSFAGYALFAADAYQDSRAATLNLPVPVDPVRGNAEAVRLLALYQDANGDEQDAIGGRLCVIARGMYWRDVGKPLAAFLQNEGCY